MSYSQEYAGKASYQSDLYVDMHRLFVAVQCWVGDVSDLVDAMLDTAAEWCVLSADQSRILGYDESLEYPVRLETRLGTFYGRLEPSLSVSPLMKGSRS